MTFENPVWLILTPLIVLLIAGLIFFGLRRRETLLSQFVAARLLDKLTEQTSLQRTLIKAGLLLLACTLIGLALARPQYGIEFVERKARGLDVVFVLDSSRSMLATDIRPSRLERAKLAIIDLVKRLENDRIGLVVFAGSAFLQTPPTLDYSAFRENLNAVSPSSISRGGSNIGQALREAVKAFPKDNNFKVVILLTDGEDLEAQAIDTARKIAQDGINIYSIGIGTPEGTYLKVRTDNGTEEFIRDSSGQPVRSQLDEVTLQKIAQLTGGSYSRLIDQSIDTLYTSVLATLPREELESELQEIRMERYQWVLLAAIVCLIVEILILRRKKTSVQIIITLALFNLFSPAPINANGETSSNPEEITQDVTENTITDPRVFYNQAHVYLENGDYLKAQTYYEQAIEQSDNMSLKRDALYNLAHVNHQIGETALKEQDYEAAIESWKQAEQLFQAVNEIDSADTASQEDAQKMEVRRKALEEFLQNQKSQQQQQQQQDQQDSESKSEENEQNKQDEQNQQSESSSDEASNNDTSESSDNKSEAQSSENQERNSSENTSAQENSAPETEQSDSESPVQNKPESTDIDENKTSESTRDPVEDIQQPDEQESTNNKGEETEQSESSEIETTEARDESAAVSEDNPGDAENEQSAQAIVEGMNILEAQALLNSLRNDERLLPFTEESSKAEQNEKARDW